ncbi:MAG: hypothetical protein IPF99_00655 [Deltaproteobacteria bacterium]|nr:hypothetical protein [Deltaproteobacteria bacterium]
MGRNATVQSYVLVRVGASDSEIQRAAVQQLRPLFGAMKAHDIGLGNRLDSPTATSFIDVSTFVRDTVDVIDPAHPETRVSQMQRVRFTYRDRAVVNLRHKSRRAWSTKLALRRLQLPRERDRPAVPERAPGLGRVGHLVQLRAAPQRLPDAHHRRGHPACGGAAAAL